MKLEIPLEVSFDPERKKNRMHMKTSDCIATVKDDNGNEIGSVTGCFGGGTEIHFNENGKTYYISAQAFWNSFCEALNKKEYIINN